MQKVKSDLISILMPVKNGQSFLSECIESIENQSINDWELIAVDDHSEDDSAKIVKKYASVDSRIHLISNKGQGIAKALETALDYSRGEFISRMDCDDLMAVEKLEKLRKYLKSSEGNRFSTCLVSYFSDNTLGEGYRAYEVWMNDVLLNGKIYTEIYRECTIPSPAWMAYKADLLKFGFLKNLGIPEDYEMTFRFYEYGFEPVVVGEKLHYWRDHSERVSRKNEHYNIRRFGPFKLRKFLSLELKKEDDLVLWGSGKKGKELAGILVNEGIEFNWVTENKNKIGHIINSKKIESKDILSRLRQPKVIISVSNKQDQLDIGNFLNNSFKENDVRYFFFF